MKNKTYEIYIYMQILNLNIKTSEGSISLEKKFLKNLLGFASFWRKSHKNRQKSFKKCKTVIGFMQKYQKVVKYGIKKRELIINKILELKFEDCK